MRGFFFFFPLLGKAFIFFKCHYIDTKNFTYLVTSSQFYSIFLMPRLSETLSVGLPLSLLLCPFEVNPLVFGSRFLRVTFILLFPDPESASTLRGSDLC